MELPCHTSQVTDFQEGLCLVESVSRSVGWSVDWSVGQSVSP